MNYEIITWLLYFIEVVWRYSYSIPEGTFR
jgi:hypothetical protein